MDHELVKVVLAGEAILGKAEEVAHRIEERVLRAIGGAAYDPPRLVARYGPPDLDEATGEEPGPPPPALRLLTYCRERVRAVYVRDESASGPPKWALLGFIEPGTNAVLGPEEVAERMRGRGAPQEGD